MPTEEKIQAVDEMAELLTKSTGIYLADFTGIDVPTFTALRKRLFAEQVNFRVVKNRLAKLAAEKAGIAGIGEALEGPTGFVYTENDPVAPAKLLSDFSKEAEGKPRIKLGLLEGQVYVEEQVQALAELPSRDVLLGQVVGTIQSPISGLVFTLSGILQSFVGTLKALADKRTAEGE